MGGLPRDGDVGILLEERAQARADQHLRVGDKYADRWRRTHGVRLVRTPSRHQHESS
jgi:hypothetical protein